MTVSAELLDVEPECMKGDTGERIQLLTARSVSGHSKRKDLVRAKQEAYWNAGISSNAGMPRKLWHCLDSLLLRDKKKKSSPSQTTVTAGKLSAFFYRKTSLKKKFCGIVMT